MDDLTVLAEGLRFPEGPIAMPDGSVLLVEIARGTLSRVRDGAVEVVAKLGGGPNGAAIGPDGACYVCNNGGFQWIEAGDRLFPGEEPESYAGGRIEKVDLASGAIEVLYTHCNGQPLRGPNDLVFDADGGFWFTDHGKTRPRERDRTGVFYARADGSRIDEVIFPLEGPNGIGLSPDGSELYVAETHTGGSGPGTVASPGRPEARAPRPAGRRPPGGRAPRLLPVRLPGRGGRRQRLRRHPRRRRHHGAEPPGRRRGVRAHARPAHHQHLLRRAGPAHRLHHLVVHRQAGVDAVAAPRIEAQPPARLRGAPADSLQIQAVHFLAFLAQLPVQPRHRTGRGKTMNEQPKTGTTCADLSAAWPRRRADDEQINLTPMLDVVFIMLIFFIVTATFVKEVGIDINQPDDDKPKTVDPDKKSIVVRISSRDRITIAQREVDWRSVRANIERLHAEEPRRRRWSFRRTRNRAPKR
jgi:biopolymer transport protein ExbD